MGNINGAPKFYESIQRKTRKVPEDPNHKFEPYNLDSFVPIGWPKIEAANKANKGTAEPGEKSGRTSKRFVS
ncbi:hypothetical protein K0M31_003827 [Melipona bicolor]|uniref:Uncharacterized protein n=1 Tax=Melipona bicolor TaxID=60889 RepID=A0AA40FXM6_9HYME|nr:hypothetical protein K0M31_003827 [Melipona bicolor]